MKTSCEIVRDLLPLYSDGVASEESKKMVEAHLADCAACRRELQFMEADNSEDPIVVKEQKVAVAAQKAWKKGRNKSFLKGCIAVLMAFAVIVGSLACVCWFSSADVKNQDALAKQAAVYFDREELLVRKTVQRAGYLAVLLTDKKDDVYLCVFERDRIFPKRWRAAGGTYSVETGHLGSWHYGSPAGETVLVFGGSGISQKFYGYRFENDGVIYTCPIDEGTVLDLFVIPDGTDIGGAPVLLAQ